MSMQMEQDQKSIQLLRNKYNLTLMSVDTYVCIQVYVVQYCLT